MVKDAAMLGRENESILCCYNQFYGSGVYLCLPCFYMGLYKFSEDKTNEVFNKWRSVFDEKNIAFEIAYKPGNFTNAFFAFNFDLAPRSFCFMIDIEKAFIEKVKPKKMLKVTTAKTPELVCCGCFESPAPGGEEQKESSSSAVKKEKKKGKASNEHESQENSRK